MPGTKCQKNNAQTKMKNDQMKAARTTPTKMTHRKKTANPWPQELERSENAANNRKLPTW